jgi:5-deoxy-glucuronate isomerase
MTQWFYPRGTLRRGVWESVVDDTVPGWTHTGMRVGDSADAAVFTIEPDHYERQLYVLSGESLSVTYRIPGSSEDVTVELAGRKSVFHGPADYLYVPVGTALKIEPRGRFMVCESVARVVKPVALTRAADVVQLIRGTGPACRQVHDFGGVDHLDADRMVSVEVIVPSGNWSGIPPHKHDTYVPGVESNLEEIYYFEAAPERAFEAPAQSDPIGYFRSYPSDEREIDELVEVRTGDVMLVPYGFHGPAMATPGYDLYFMNVMAGPDPDRSWNIVDDPNHGWVRDTWPHQNQDPRLPYTA